ncbi:MAG: neutral/alkaline non-lysosomal ceramidase N-terminal domain-containing protein [Bryobacteraceae bacterium]|nr:neutral/alkaline non-lysosomal ceramidase N-terminal domain-containing protein [Bryobacteraceae bacterium]
MRLAIAALFTIAVIGTARAEWQAGAAKVDITPREPIWLAGYAGRTGPSKGVIQRIYVKALALKDNAGELSAIVTSDLVGLDNAMVEEIASRARSKHGVARERLILNYSHNHSCPVTGEVLRLYYDLQGRDKATVERYTEMLTGRFDEAIGRAVRNLAPAALAFEQGLAGFGVNRRRARRRDLPGPVDHDVPVLGVRDPRGALRAVLFGYACHNTALGGDQINGDYAGFAQAELEKRYPDAVALFLMGCGGDVNPLPRYQGSDPALAPYSVELASTYGRVLATAVDLVLHGKMKPVRGPVRTAMGTAELPLEAAPSREELQERLAAAGTPFARRQVRNLLDELDRHGKLADRAPYPVQVWQFGDDLKLIALTGEPVVDYSLRFKERYGWDNTWVAGYNNDLLAYIPSLRVLAEGGYEGTEAMGEYGLAAPFAPAVEEIIAAKVDALARAAAGTAPGSARLAQIDERIRAAVAGFRGTVSLFARNLDTGESYGIREDEPVRTASTIKLPIMTAIFAAVNDGRANWTEQLPLRDADKVSGSGVIREFSNRLPLPLRDLVHMMIVVSDNTATNLLLDHFSGDAVNAYLETLGLVRTRSLRKILGDAAKLNPEASGYSSAGRIAENKRFGIGVSTPREMVSLLEKLERGELVSPQASREMIEILKRQQYKDGIGRGLGETPVASKSGALDRLRSDVGIVYAERGRLALAITCDDMPVVDYSADNAGNVFISKLTGMLMDGLLTGGK